MYGLLIGLVVSGIYSIAALIVYVLSGGDAFDVSLMTLLAAYWSGGLLSGMLLELFRPVARTKAVAVVVGPIVAFPAAACLVAVTEGFFTGWSVKEIAMTVTTAVFFGVLGGAYWGGRTSS